MPIPDRFPFLPAAVTEWSLEEQGSRFATLISVAVRSERLGALQASDVGDLGLAAAFGEEDLHRSGHAGDAFFFPDKVINYLALFGGLAKTNRRGAGLADPCDLDRLRVELGIFPGLLEAEAAKVGTHIAAARPEQTLVQIREGRFDRGIDARLVGSQRSQKVVEYLFAPRIHRLVELRLCHAWQQSRSRSRSQQKQRKTKSSQAVHVHEILLSLGGSTLGPASAGHSLVQVNFIIASAATKRAGVFEQIYPAVAGGLLLLAGESSWVFVIWTASKYRWHPLHAAPGASAFSVLSTTIADLGR